MDLSFTPAEQAFRQEVATLRLLAVELSLGDTEHHLEQFVAANAARPA